MPQVMFTRRAALAGAAALAVVGVPAFGASTPELEGAASVAAQVAFRRDGAAVLRLAALDAEARLIRVTEATPLPAAASASEAVKLAQEPILRAVARAWRVPAAGCRLSGGAVVHAASGRRMRYAVWVDFA